MRKTYHVEYKLFDADEVKDIDVIAENKYIAYEEAIEKIAEKENEYPYSAWVASVTYNNGNYHRFNTFERNPF